MKFGVREICNVVFKAKSTVRIGTHDFKAGEPVLYIESAKTSTVEGAATTAYATGGRGNSRLIAWEGEKTLTFTVEDALLSPISFSVLSGAGLFKGTKGQTVHVHTTAYAQPSAVDGSITLTSLSASEQIDKTAPVFVMICEKDGSLIKMVNGCTVAGDGKKITVTGTDLEAVKAAPSVFVDFYVTKSAANVSEMQIDMAKYGGYYYVEADTLFRRQSDGVDMPANITFPNVKIQSNFTFTMASSGDPSTFTFTMDALPGYTYFNPTKQVLCVIQVIEDTEGEADTVESVMLHNETTSILDDSTKTTEVSPEALSEEDTY